MARVIHLIPLPLDMTTEVSGAPVEETTAIPLSTDFDLSYEDMTPIED